MSEEEDELAKRRGKPAKPRKRKPSKAEKARRNNTTVQAVKFLTSREMTWVKLVVGGATPTDAVRLAGWRSDGTRAKMRAWRLGQKPLIQAALHSLGMEVMIANAIEPGKVIGEVAKIAFTPDFLLASKPTPADKLKALDKLTALMGMVEKNAPQKTVNIINLIAQSIPANKVAAAISVMPTEAIDVPATAG